MHTKEPIEETQIIGWGSLAEFLKEKGYPYSKSTLTKYGCRTWNIDGRVGPPVEGYWGFRPVFLPSRVLEWAKKRVKDGIARNQKSNFLPQETRTTKGTRRKPEPQIEAVKTTTTRDR